MNSTTFETPQTKTTTPAPSGVLQRSCACGQLTGGGGCSACERKRHSLQRSTRDAEHDTQDSNDVPPIVHEVLRSPGQPLDSATRSFFEPRFEHDFSHVRVHADAKAAESAQSVNALAYTVGRHVVFNGGQPSFETASGRHLLAHELTHVVQQSGARDDSFDSLALGSDDGFEAEAAAVASSYESGQARGVNQLACHSIQRQRGGGRGPAAEHRFTAEGVRVTVRSSCEPAVFGFANVENGTRLALNAIFNSECIEESRRTRMQRNLRRHGLDIRCQRSANLPANPGACAESTGFPIPANIFTVGSSSFAGHPDSSPGCQPIESIILHEIVHLVRGFATESLPGSCEASCFGVGGGDPALCRDIDVFGNRRVP